MRGDTHEDDLAEVDDAESEPGRAGEADIDEEDIEDDDDPDIDDPGDDGDEYPGCMNIFQNHDWDCPHARENEDDGEPTELDF